VEKKKYSNFWIVLVCLLNPLIGFFIYACTVSEYPEIADYAKKWAIRMLFFWTVVIVTAIIAIVLMNFIY